MIWWMIQKRIIYKFIHFGEVTMRDFRPKAMDDVDRIDEGDPYIYHRKCCNCNWEGTLED